MLGYTGLAGLAVFVLTNTLADTRSALQALLEQRNQLDAAVARQAAVAQAAIAQSREKVPPWRQPMGKS